MTSFFDKMLQLPLFQGLTVEEMTAILSKARLHFEKHSPGTTMVQAGAPCQKLVYILRGNFEKHTSVQSEQAYEVVEHLSDTWLIEPYSLFGMNTTYRSTYVAESLVHILSIEKSCVLDELFNYPIFRLNFMNMVSKRSQVMHNRLWSGYATGTANRLIAFFASRFDTPQGRKQLHIDTAELALNASLSEAEVRQTLQEFESQGVVTLQENGLYIPNATRLFALYNHDNPLQF